MLHKNALVGDRHAVHDWEVADATALAALVPLSTDVGKIAKVASPLGFYILANHTGPVWHKLANAGDIPVAHADLASLDADDHAQYALLEGNTRSVFYTNDPTTGQVPIWNATESRYENGDQSGGGGGGNRVELTEDTTYYVATTGNDTIGDGTVGAPWLTIQKAVDWVAANVDGMGYAVIIQVADGSYTSVTVSGKDLVGVSLCTIRGNTTTPTNVDIEGSGSAVWGFLRLHTNYKVEGFHTDQATSGLLFVAAEGSVLELGVNSLGNAGSSNHIYAIRKGTIHISGNLTISGSATYSIAAGDFSYIFVQSAISITFSGTPTFNTTAFAFGISNIQLGNVTFSGSVTGKRYESRENSLIDTNGGGASFIPGNSSGSTATGGLYV